MVQPSLKRAALVWLAVLQTGCAGLLNWSAPAPHARSAHASGPVNGDRYTVRRGDTLYSIAFRTQLDYRELAAWNGIGSDYTIYPGQVLRLSPPQGSRSVAEASASPATNRVPDAPARPTPKPMAPPAPVVASAPSFSAQQWEWPTRGTVARGFDPADGAKGIDIAGDYGQIVVAAAAGKVVYSGSALKGYGELIIVKHDEDYLSAYGYNRRRLVQEGEWVAAGQPIAELGMGPQQKPLLHFEIRDKGRPVDPLPLLPKR